MPLTARRSLQAALSALLVTLVVSPAASQAAWFPGESIDGPSSDILSLGDVDLARDGDGALAYLKRDGGVAHVFVSRMLDGVWAPPERADAGLAGAASAASIASGDGNRIIAVFVSDGRLYGTVAEGGGEVRPLSPPQLLADAGPTNPVTNPHVDLAVNGTAYAVYSQGGDVRAVRFESGVWEAVSAPLDVDPVESAGVGAAGRPRVAVSAEGNAVATWAESGLGRRRVFGRRITGLVPSSAPQEVSLATGADGVAGGDADSPDVDVEDDGSYAWVVWRQDFGGVSRTVARRLVGSLFEAPTALDAGGPSGAPRFEMSGRGVGASVVVGAGGSVLSGLVDETNVFVDFPRLDGGGGATNAVVAAAEREQHSVAWIQGGAVRARFKPADDPFEPEATVSVADFGAVQGGPEISSDGRGDSAVAFVQGGATPGEARRLVAAVYDRLPAAPGGRTTTSFQRDPRPRLVWGTGSDLWGGQSFAVFVDGAQVATTASSPFRLAAPLADGVHRWRVDATDRRGQVVPMRERDLKIDATAPTGRLRVSGRRSRGQGVVFTVTAKDTAGGSGIRGVSVDFGDRTKPSKKRRAVHRYTRGGSFNVVASVTDRAGNVVELRKRVRVAR